MRKRAKKPKNIWMGNEVPVSLSIAQRLRAQRRNIENTIGATRDPTRKGSALKELTALEKLEKGILEQRRGEKEPHLIRLRTKAEVQRLFREILVENAKPEKIIQIIDEYLMDLSPTREAKQALIELKNHYARVAAQTTEIKPLQQFLEHINKPFTEERIIKLMEKNSLKQVRELLFHRASELEHAIDRIKSLAEKERKKVGKIPECAEILKEFQKSESALALFDRALKWEQSIDAKKGREKLSAIRNGFKWAQTIQSPELRKVFTAYFKLLGAQIQ